MRRTKIVATIGPASRDPEVLVRMVEAGMDVARLNFSHGSHADHAARIAMVRRAADEAGRHIALLQDLQGPKIRTGSLERGKPVKLVDNVLANSFDVIESGVYYLEQSAGDARLQFFSFATRRSTTVAAKLGRVGPVVSVSSDGRTIFFSRIDSATDDLMLVEKFR